MVVEAPFGQFGTGRRAEHGARKLAVYAVKMPGIGALTTYLTCAPQVRQRDANGGNIVEARVAKASDNRLSPERHTVPFRGVAGPH